MIKQVTSLNSSAAAIVVTPSNACKLLIIQNNGANTVRLSFDGGAAYTNPYSGRAGTNPTTTSGVRLTANSQMILPMSYGGSGYHLPVVGIMESGTTTLDIITDDPLST